MPSLRILNSNRGTVFTAAQQRVLEAQLRDRAKLLIPALEQAVRSYAKTEEAVAAGWAERRNTASKQVAAARIIERRVGRLLEAIYSAEPLLLEAVIQGDVPVDYEPEAASSGPSLKVLLTRRADVARPHSGGKALRDLIGALIELVQTTTGWQQRAGARSLRKRGRTIGIRRDLARWVGQRLQAGGVKVSTNPDGRFGLVLQMVYEAAGIETPIDLYRDLHWVMRALADRE